METPHDPPETSPDNDAVVLLSSLLVPEGTRCTWCDEPLSTGEAYGDAFLTTVFGYYYCSREHRNAHVLSK